MKLSQPLPWPHTATLITGLAVVWGFALAHPQGIALKSAAPEVIAGTYKGPTAQAPTTRAAELEIDLGDYLFQFFTAEGDADRGGHYQIVRQGKVVYKAVTDSDTLRLLDAGEDRHNYKPRYDVALTPTITRAIVIEAPSAAGGHRYTVLSLNEMPQMEATFEEKERQFNLMDSDDNGIFEFCMSDHFDEWGQQPLCPQLCYQLTGQGEKAGLKLAKHQVDETLLEQNIPELKGQFADLAVTDGEPITEAPTQLAEELAELIYAGHEDQASKLLDRVWPTKPEDWRARKAAFYRAFKQTLAQSPYWPEVEKLNQR